VNGGRGRGVIAASGDPLNSIARTTGYALGRSLTWSMKHEVDRVLLPLLRSD